MAAHVSPSVFSNQELLQFAKETNQKVNEEVESARRCLGIEHPHVGPLISTFFYKKYGLNRSLKYYQFNSLLVQIRTIISEVGNSQYKFDISTQNSFLRLAASKCGFGACCELAMNAASRLIQKTSILFVCLVVKGNEATDNHSFLLLLNSKKVEQVALKLIKQSPSFIDFMQTLPKEAVVVDPWFNTIFPISELETTGRDFLECSEITKMFISKKNCIFWEKESAVFAERIEMAANQCAADLRTKKLIPTAISSSSAPTMYDAAKKIELMMIPALTLITGSQGVWKLSLSRLTMFSVMDVNKLEEISGLFREANVPFMCSEVVGKPKICFEVSDLDQLHAYYKQRVSYALLEGTMTG